MENSVTRAPIPEIKSAKSKLKPSRCNENERPRLGTQFQVGKPLTARDTGHEGKQIKSARKGKRHKGPPEVPPKAPAKHQGEHRQEKREQDDKMQV